MKITASLGVAFAFAAAILTAGATPASASAQSDYIAVAGPAAQTVRQQYDIPASVTVAQSILESAWGQSRLSANDRNYFGFKCTSAGQPGPIAVGCHDYPTQECTPTCHTVHAYFRVYATMTDSFRDYGRLLTTSATYADALPYRHDPDRFIQAVARHYATDPDYAGKVVNLMRTYDLYRFDTGAPAPAAGPMFHQVRDAAGNWSGFQPLAGFGTTQPGDARDMSVAGLPDGSSQVLIVGADGGVYHQVRGANGSWTGFQPLPGMGTTETAKASRVAIAGLPDGSAQVLIVGADGGIYHQVREADGDWTGFAPVAGMGTTDMAKGTDVAIAGLADGSAQILVIGADGGVYHEIREPDGDWTGFRPLAGMGTTDTAKGSRVAIAGLPDGSSQVLVIGADGGVYHQARYPLRYVIPDENPNLVRVCTDANGCWSGFKPLAGMGTTDPARGGDVAIAGLPDESAQVLIVGADGGVYHQVRDAEGRWTGFQPLAGQGTTDTAHGSGVSIAGLPDGTAQVTIVGQR